MTGRAETGWHRWHRSPRRPTWVPRADFPKERGRGSRKPLSPSGKVQILPPNADRYAPKGPAGRAKDILNRSMEIIDF